jgi:hypothetical protein
LWRRCPKNIFWNPFRPKRECIPFEEKRFHFSTNASNTNVPKNESTYVLQQGRNSSIFVAGARRVHIYFQWTNTSDADVSTTEPQLLPQQGSTDILKQFIPQNFSSYSSGNESQTLPLDEK